MRTGLLLAFLLCIFTGCASTKKTGDAAQALYLVIDDIGVGTDPAEGLQVLHSIAIPLDTAKRFSKTDEFSDTARVYTGSYTRRGTNLPDRLQLLIEENPKTDPAKKTRQEMEIYTKAGSRSVLGPYPSADGKIPYKQVYRCYTISPSPEAKEIDAAFFR